MEVFGFLNNKRFWISPGLFFDAIFVLSNNTLYVRKREMEEIEYGRKGERYLYSV